MLLGPRLVLAALLWMLFWTLLARQPHAEAAEAEAAAAAAPHAHPHGSLAPEITGTKPKSQRCQRAARQRPPDCAAIRKHCAEYGSGLAGYVDLYYCVHSAWQPAVLSLMALWLGVLFVWLGVSASEYFSPNISTLATLLRLPESFAGVTLLALGNGAPDLFSTFSAVRAGSAALAISQLVGSASFIVGIVAGATTFIAPRYKVSRISYLRELGFFTATAAIVSAIVLAEKLTRTLALCMVGLYLAYVLTVMLTTYYEEQCRDLGLATEDDWLSAMYPQHPEIEPVSEPDMNLSLVLDASARPLIARLHSRSYGALPLASEDFGRNTNAGTAIRRHSHVFGNASTSAVATVDDARGRARARRQTINIPHAPLGYRAHANDEARGSSLVAANNPSLRALGGFLHRHRKSLLAIAECQDILSEIRDSSSTSRTEALAAIPADAAAADDVAASHSISMRSPNDSAELRIHACDVGAPIQQIAAVTSSEVTCAPAVLPWNNYKMQSSGRNSAHSHSPGNPLSIDKYEDNITSESASNHLQITPTSPLTTRPSQSFVSAKASSRAAASSMVAPKHSSSHHSDYLSPAFCNRSCHSTSKQSHLRSRTPNSVSIVDLLAALPVSPLSSYSSRHASSDEVRQRNNMSSNNWERALSLAYACIPTLHYWRRDASTSLKLFIAVSAVPVLMLTLTVPVVKDVPATSDQCLNDQDHSSSCHSIDCDANRDGTLSEGTPCLPLVSSRSPSLHSQQAGSADLALRSCHKSSLICSSPSMEWAARMTSYFRSAVSAPFMFAALLISGYNIHAISPLAQSALVCATSAMSLFANYITCHSAHPPYWLMMTPCLVGFVCGLAWVYIVADEIVSITQALGLILNLSEEIMGLTVVGFGNSLGDLVTNLTLTRMGYPMMAISACFGGPMLCLLLGVGVAAFASLASGEISSGAYRIPLTSPTVLVSTACLLFNSALFLFVVPRQRYYMTRTVGSMAMIVYLVGMVVNVYLVT
ncbi:hypothetical protein LPJ64_004086 [Coemansia asiatica]|uniref:Sodium/calcium exchanger membrane region domain-containing protein n=1 Tax=Coemansia asiatica TaxID=1052880 RepID=A0A9W7XJR2_9FUNG|nr:hypothetical protein LPJ64_004086 [Coemansia asiatica]